MDCHKTLSLTDTIKVSVRCKVNCGYYRPIQTLADLYSPTWTDNEVTSSLYDFTGKVIKTLTRQVFQSNTNTVLQTNTYDQAGRLTQVKHQVNGQAEVILASMEYNELGQLKQKSLHGAVGNGIQNLNYAYNIRGWLEKINNPDVTPSSSSSQKLNLGLYYNSVPTGLPATVKAQYNGNISSVVWNTPEQSGALSPADKQGYGFTYDGLNRLLSSTYGEGAGFGSQVGANNENLTYDKNGNILTLVRYKKGTGIIDNLAYAYKSNGSSNQLDRVDDSQTIDNGFTELIKQAGEYGYDLNGNLTSDLNKGYTSIQYNFLNLPKRVSTTSQYISYIYSAEGNKLAKVGTNGVVTTYAGSFVYEGSSLKYIIHPEGMYLPGGNYQYYLKDHLGNTRLMVNTSGSGGTVVQQTDYYPFGMDIASYNGGVDNRYRYNGKELQTDEIGVKKLDWYDYGARMYDAQLGRWHTPDPMANLYYGLTPYNYALNNPIINFDPNGMWVETYYGDEARDYARQLLSQIGASGNDGDDGQEKNKENNVHEQVGVKPQSGGGTPWYSIYNWPGAGSSARTMDAIYAGDYLSATGHFLTCAAEIFTLGFASEINLGTKAVSTAAKSGTTTVTDGSIYSVAFEWKLASSSYPGVYRGAHFLEANKALSATMGADTRFASTMSELGIAIPRSSTGAILGKSPANWVWHHDIEAGVMQLVPKAQHTVGSSYWGTLHPNGLGGFAIWGK